MRVSGIWEYTDWIARIKNIESRITDLNKNFEIIKQITMSFLRQDNMINKI